MFHQKICFPVLSDSRLYIAILQGHRYLNSATNTFYCASICKKNSHLTALYFHSKLIHDLENNCNSFDFRKTNANHVETLRARKIPTNFKKIR